MKVFLDITRWVAVASAAVLVALPVQGAVYTLKNGMQVEGLPGKIASLGSDLATPDGGQGESSPKLILFADDGIRVLFSLRTSCIRQYLPLRPIPRRSKFVSVLLPPVAGLVVSVPFCE